MTTHIFFSPERLPDRERESERVRESPREREQKRQRASVRASEIELDRHTHTENLRGKDISDEKR